MIWNHWFDYTCFDYLQIFEYISKNFITLIRQQIFVLVLWCGMVRLTVYFRKICCYISILFIFVVLDNLFVGSKKLNICIVEKVSKVTKKQYCGILFSNRYIFHISSIKLSWVRWNQTAHFFFMLLCNHLLQWPIHP